MMRPTRAPANSYTPAPPHECHDPTENSIPFTAVGSRDSRKSLASGAPRCYTMIKMDERSDRFSSAEDKVASVQRHLAAGKAHE